MTDLGTLPGGPNVSQNDSNALSINKTGTIVGYSSSANGTHPFVYKNGSWTDLGTLGGSSSGSLAYDVNDSDQVVGITQTPDQAFTAFFWQSGSMSKLLSGKDTSAATTINNNGTVAGWGRVEGGSARCLVWSSGVVTELGTLGGDYCEAHGSNIGDVVGQSSLADGNVHAFKLVGSVITKGQCKNFGWQTYDFLNQGRCVSSLVSKKP